ncbi:G-protein coupled receptor 35-like [Hypanus sabinus]|uniref:G-protein coupled receptor 35-like n=1 Tax=Hypanus sabinus TaxID=79690 RepID=UPI0028C4FBFB|nr:G-protein coupled receptor 35-like [Hypanus sabinus]
MALWVFCWKLRKWTETTIYMTNLAVADTLVLLSLPFKVYSYKNDWNLGFNFCAFLECLYFLNMYVSIYTTVCICVDRYIAIKYPLNAVRYRSPMKAAIACGITWTFVSLTRISLQIQLTKEAKDQHKCFNKKSKEPSSLWIVIVIELAGFIIPAIILSFCSFQIITTLRKRKMESYGSIRFSKTIAIIATNLATFFICYLPFHLGYFLQFLFESSGQDCVKQDIVRTFVRVSICLANGNCCLDAVVYYFASVEIRNYFRPKKTCRKDHELCIITQCSTPQEARGS